MAMGTHELSNALQARLERLVFDAARFGATS
jgi:hypothetical protein